MCFELKFNLKLGQSLHMSDFRNLHIVGFDLVRMDAITGVHQNIVLKEV